MPSISQAQASLGRDFDLGGSQRQADIALNNVEAIMVQYAAEFIKKAKATITKKGKIDTGNLSDIVVGNIVQQGTKYSFSLLIISKIKRY